MFINIKYIFICNIFIFLLMDFYSYLYILFLYFLEYICICYNVLDYIYVHDNNLFIGYNIMLIYLSLNNIIKII
jgi:hypothetical protein